MADVSYRSVLFLIKFLFIVDIVLFVCSCMLVRARLRTFVLVPRSWCRSPGTGWGSRSLVSHGHHGGYGHQGRHGQGGHGGHSYGGHGSHVGLDQKEAKIES